MPPATAADGVRIAYRFAVRSNHCSCSPGNRTTTTVRPGPRRLRLAANPGPHPVLGDPTMPTYAKGRHLVASNGHDAWDELPKIQAPTLILHGTDDIFSPAGNAKLLADRIPNAHAELLQGARHAYFHEFQAVASPLVLDFLQAV